MLNKKTIYGLHALLHLARNPHQHIGASKIAEATSAPYKFLALGSSPRTYPAASC
jgi:DNA-binding IscR family transcriptional regulator